MLIVPSTFACNTRYTFSDSMGRALGYSRLFMGRDLLPENRKEYAHAIAIYTTHIYYSEDYTQETLYIHTYCSIIILIRGNSGLGVL